MVTRGESDLFVYFPPFFFFPEFNMNLIIPEAIVQFSVDASNITTLIRILLD